MRTYYRTKEYEEIDCRATPTHCKAAKQPTTSANDAPLVRRYLVPSPVSEWECWRVKCGEICSSEWNFGRQHPGDSGLTLYLQLYYYFMPMP